MTTINSTRLASSAATPPPARRRGRGTLGRGVHTGSELGVRKLQSVVVDAGAAGVGRGYVGQGCEVDGASSVVVSSMHAP